MCVCVCVTPEPSTKRRMSLARRGAAEALMALAADDGPGGRAGGALMGLAGAGAVVASSNVPLIAKLVFIGFAITYVLW